MGTEMRKNKYKYGDIVPVNVAVQGGVRVNTAVAVLDCGNCLLLRVDLHSKYARLLSVGSGEEEGPSVYLAADKNTLNLDETKPRDAVTLIEFPEFEGWSVFAANEPGRYTMALVLLEPSIEAL